MNARTAKMLTRIAGGDRNTAREFKRDWHRMPHRMRGRVRKKIMAKIAEAEKQRQNRGAAWRA